MTDTNQAPADAIAADPKALAKRVADALGDSDNLLSYEAFCRVYPEASILKALAKTSVVPKSKIRHSRIALFVYLLKHAKRPE